MPYQNRCPRCTKVYMAELADRVCQACGFPGEPIDKHRYPAVMDNLVRWFPEGIEGYDEMGRGYTAPPPPSDPEDFGG